MLRTLLLTSFLALTVPAHAAGRISLPLDDGGTLMLDPVPAARNVPYVYVDQALETLSTPAAHATVLVHRRLGNLGGNAGVSYSLIAYATAERPDQVSLEGQALLDGHAWTWGVVVPREHWEQALPVVLEALSSLPSQRR